MVQTLKKKRKKKNNHRFLAKPNEPVWDPTVDEDRKQGQLCTIFNWYHQHENRKSAKKWFLQYLKESKKTKDEIAACKEVHDSYFCLTAGWVARLIINESIGLPENCESFLNKTFDKLYSKGIVILEAKREKEKSVVRRKNVQEIMQEQLHNYLGALDEKIDEFVLNRCKSDFEIEEWLRSNEIKGIQARRISEKFVPLENELKEAVKGKDDQLNEGYGFLKKAQLKRYAKFVSNIVSKCEEYYSTNLTKNRRIRKRKTKTPSQLIAKVQHQEECDEHNIKSFDPRKILGAQQIWTYNTKYKVLTVYHAADADGFFIKGTTIQNFDEEKSISKRLRKPKEILPKVVEGGKVQLRKLFPTIRTKEVKTTGRLNKNTLLLRLLK